MDHLIILALQRSTLTTTDVLVAGVSDEEINKITHENVGRFYDLDLFTDVPKEQAGVASLRTLATDVDTSITTKAEHRRRDEAASAGSSFTVTIPRGSSGAVEAVSDPSDRGDELR